MKYRSTDRLQDFEFHDSGFRLSSWEEDCLILSVSNLNIHKDASPVPVDADMELAEARITFRGIRVCSFEPSRLWKTDADGKSYTDEPRIIYEGETALEKFRDELADGIDVYYFQKDGDEYEIGASGNDPYFVVRLTFSSVDTEWDCYRKKAWYELHKHYKKQLTLSSPDGDTVVDAWIICHYEDVINPGGEMAEAPSVSIGVKYNGAEIRGYGNDLLWVDAFRDLQKKLPDGVRIKCCMTCRHGNMCPVGNAPGELFCTKDLLITQKSDLYYCTEDEAERAKRSRDCTFVCEDHEEPSAGYFTYNDYSCC